MLDDSTSTSARSTLGLGSSAVVDAGTGASEMVQLDASSKLPAVDGSALINLPKLGVDNLLIVVEEQVTGTNGGTSTADAWTARVLNTVKFNNISGSSLASNQVTIPAGTYYYQGSSPMRRTDDLKLRLRDVTNSVTLDLSPNLYSNSSATYEQARHEFSGTFVVAGEIDLEFQYWANVSSATTGLGEANNIDSTAEVYSELKLWKVG